MAIINDTEKKEFGKWYIFLGVLVVGTVIVFTTLGYFGKVTGTIVERKVFENSYQKVAGDNARTKTYRAQLAQIDYKLSQDIDEDLRQELESQRAMLKVQLAN